MPYLIKQVVTLCGDYSAREGLKRKKKRNEANVQLLTKYRSRQNTIPVVAFVGTFSQ